MMDLVKKNEDLKFGFKNEDVILKIIKEIFTNTYKTKEKYNHFDFRNDTLKLDFELKSRRIYKGQYPTIFFAECKLKKGREKMRSGETFKVIYLFNFVQKENKELSELWYWEDDGSELKITMEGNLARNDIRKRCANIPMDQLQRFI
jgi:hypothetical protein